MTANSEIEFFTLKLSLGSQIVLHINNIEQNGSCVLSALIGENLISDLSKGVKQTCDENILELKWPGLGHLRIEHKSENKNHIYAIEWQLYSKKVLTDIFELREANWYGIGQVMKQYWPINKWQIGLVPFVTGDSFKDGQIGGVQERYFLSSRGIAISVDEHVPLFISFNLNGNKQLVLQSKFASPYNNTEGLQPFLKYSIFQSGNIKEVHNFAASHIFKMPTGWPDELLFKAPIFSTWASYKKNINEQVVLDFADKIKENGFPSCQLEIDDDWTPRYGDMEFDLSKFPDPKRFIKALKEKGFRVTLWVHPFASLRSQAAGKNFWMSSLTTGYTIWWNGIAKSLDVTNPAATAWFRNTLKDLAREYGICSFKFDAGEFIWLPSGYTSHEPLKSPNEYTSKYAELCHSIDAECKTLEVRVGHRTQHLPMVVRMMDKQSTWGYDNGLRTIIPSALTFGLIGYPFVLPDMVGGNAYSGNPDRELYIRWMEVNALLPFIQISVLPWGYDQEVVDIARNMVELHNKYADLFIHLAKNSSATGEPIIRPLWWVAPDNEIAQTIDSQFLVGDDLLVAPVLDLGVDIKSVYLPKGRWKSMNGGEVLDGEKWINDYPAPLNELLHFERVKD